MTYFYKNLFLIKSIIVLFLTGTTSLALCQAKITGQVISGEDKLPLPGASIVEKGTMNDTNTDIDGKFEIISTTEKPTLIFSYVGFKTQEKTWPLVDDTMVTLELSEEIISCSFISECRFNKVGYNAGANYNPTGLRISTMTPFLFGASVFIRSDFTYRFEGENSSFLDLELGKYKLLYIGRLQIGVMGKYTKIRLPDGTQPEIIQKVLAPEITYRGFKLISGYVNQGVKDNERHRKGNGIILGLSKRIAWQLSVGFRTMHVMGQWQYGISVTEDIRAIPISLAIRHQRMGDYKEFDFSVLYRIGRSD